MSRPHVRASFIEFTFADEKYGRLIRALYEKQFPGRNFGSLELKRFVCSSAKEDQNFVFAALKVLRLMALPYGREPDFHVASVFLETEVTNAEKWLLLSQRDSAVVRMCWVCREPMLSGQHKHMLLHCHACANETVHETPFFGHPFRCVVCRG